jgi:hypothetical protein
VSKVCPTCKRPLFRNKSHEQRKKFHAICADIGREIGLTPGQVKAAIKQEHFGLDEFKFGNKWYRTVQSSEDTDRPEYSELIETALRWAAENGVVIPDAQTT